ncbi:DUF1127 domain-containing protein [Aestuariispira insulae]|uniref:Uncharacterized protein YjiS (DUF1127 family) n=1 Tax=Aestuariispira insulae TaxID=1461337 RepID=A0A3D9HJS1_9PROT|nr:hypothetical protein [Aestuariispira insulae]RED49704.1 uncharacterized protein YjiS (DUF1127 family) [Aestuariispira insulae]
MSEIAKPCHGTIEINPTIIKIQNPFAVLWNAIVCWYYRAEERRQMKELEPRLREDLGLSDEDIFGEMSKPFWRR